MEGPPSGFWSRRSHSQAVVLVGGCGLAFGAAFTNTGVFLRTSTSVSHLTGDLSRLSIDLVRATPEVAGDLRRVGAAFVCFFAGALLSGMLVHHPTLDLERPYGRIIAGIGASVVRQHAKLKESLGERSGSKGIKGLSIKDDRVAMPVANGRSRHRGAPPAPCVDCRLHCIRGHERHIDERDEKALRVGRCPLEPGKQRRQLSALRRGVSDETDRFGQIGPGLQQGRHLFVMNARHDGHRPQPGSPQGLDNSRQKRTTVERFEQGLGTTHPG